MAIKKVEIQDHLGNVYYPHTEANVVFTKDGKTVEEKIEDLKQSANNGKNIVANAIGSPLLATDNFSEMGNKIDSLLVELRKILNYRKIKVNDSHKLNDIIFLINNALGAPNLPPWYDVKIGPWITAKDMLSIRLGFSATSVGNKVYIIGGSDKDSIKIPRIECYDVDTNTWSIKKDMITSRSGLSSQSVGAKIYAIGGEDSTGYATNINECYDAETNLWSTKNNMPTNRRSFALAKSGSKLYAIEGVRLGTRLSTNECYDTITDTWTSKTSSSYKRYYSSATELNNKIYIVGYESSKFSCYDTITDTWTEKSDVPSVAANYMKTLDEVGGKIYSIGGVHIPTTYCYNPILDIWTLKTRVITGREYVSSAVVDNKIYILGGIDSKYNKAVTNECYLPGLDY